MGSAYHVLTRAHVPTPHLNVGPMTAQLPTDEAARLEELDSYGVLDSIPEIEYDELTYLASAICETPIALVSLVDEDRQWFKSRIGLEAQQTPRDLAFCAHAILKPDELLIVKDAAEDRRFRTNELVESDPHIRFYAGAPLVTPKGHALGTLCVIDRKPRELTERQQKALQALASQVMGQLELRKTTSRLISVNIALHDANSEIRRMYHTLTHELKTPLTSTREFISIVLDGLAGEVSTEQREYLEGALAGCDHLAGHVNDLVDISRMETGKLSLDPARSDLNRLVKRVLVGAGAEAVRRGITLTHSLEDMGPCWIDERRITQVISNLLSNALKFTPDGGQVSISTATALDDPDTVEVAVCDTGVGIPDKDQPHIFNRLYQVSDECWATKGGLGLGLYICKEVVELHGGTIWLESQPEQGSAFKFRIPVDVASMGGGQTVEEDQVKV